jgi:hypothetical protein
MEIQLLHQVGAVLIHRFYTYAEAIGNLFVFISLGDQF